MGGLYICTARLSQVELVSPVLVSLPPNLASTGLFIPITKQLIGVLSMDTNSNRDRMVPDKGKRKRDKYTKRKERRAARRLKRQVEGR